MPALACPDAPRAIGSNGGYSAETLPITWEYCEESGISFANYMYLDIPADMTGLSLSVEQGDTKTGFAYVEAGGVVLVEPTSFGQAPFLHDPLAWSVSTLGMPMNEVTFPEVGCMAILPVAAGNQEGKTGSLHVVSRVGEPVFGELDLDIVVVGGVDIFDEELSDALAVMEGLYQTGSGPLISDIQVYETSSVPDKITFEGAEVDLLRTLGKGRRMTVFLISDVLDAAGTLGWAAGIPGPNGVDNSVGSGVIVAVDGHRLVSGAVDTQTMGETIAHEIGHQLGLFHTTESDGMSHDPVIDTPECTAASDFDQDGQLTAEECLNADGNHMMFWSAGPPQTRISPIQADVLYYSPLVR